MSSEKFITITIDGGAASGKSSTAKALAKELNLLHVETGTHYRAMTLLLLNSNTLPKDEAQVKETLSHLHLETKIDGQQSTIYVNNESFTHEDLRSAAINQNVSKYAAIPEVRSFLLKYQRSQEKIAQENNFNGLVVEGRDIGSVVFPNAPFRFFLHADAATRNQRRAAEGETDSIQDRDKIDSQRKTAPLTCPAGATLIDTSQTPLESVIQQIKGLVHPQL